jgi:hypothetical protein
MYDSFFITHDGSLLIDDPNSRSVISTGGKNTVRKSARTVSTI